jgi:hypothetical protein
MQASHQLAQTKVARGRGKAGITHLQQARAERPGVLLAALRAPSIDRSMTAP